MIALVINVGMWLERFVIIAISLQRDFIPGKWDMYYPTRWDWATLAGSFGLFFVLFYLFIRFLPDDFHGGGANAGAPDGRREIACLARAIKNRCHRYFIAALTICRGPALLARLC